MSPGQPMKRETDRLQLAQRVGVAAEIAQAKPTVDGRNCEHRIIDPQDLDECAITERGRQLADVERAGGRTLPARVPRAMSHGFFELQLLGTQSAGILACRGFFGELGGDPSQLGELGCQLGVRRRSDRTPTQRARPEPLDPFEDGGRLARRDR